MHASSPRTPPRRTAAISALALLLCTFWHGSAFAWWNEQWSLRKKITVDTSPSGAGITDPIGTTPVLVRLHVSNFRFGSAKDDGSDLRFVAGDDKTPLKHHIEKYDPLLAEALVWVRVPDLKPGVKTELWLYYGNDKAQPVNDARGTYDGDAVLVYHFGDKGAPPQDATAWANHARNAVATADGAIIGQGARFDGQTSLAVAASSSLVAADGGEATVSLWVKAAALQPGAVLFSRNDGTSGYTLGLDSGVPFVEIIRDGAPQRAAATAALPAGSWRHLALVASGPQTTLYVDGVPAATLAAALPTLTGGAQIGGPSIGEPVTAAGQSAPTGAAPASDAASADAAAPPPVAGPAPEVAFSGDMDEVALAKVARPSGFIRFAAVNQGAEHGKLVSYSVDEETVGWFSGGYFGVILRSVTVDGWVVIGILAVMAVISWFVMVDRVRYLGRVAKANLMFVKLFRESDPATLFDGDIAANAPGVSQRDLAASPLFGLFAAGRNEVSRRMTAEAGAASLSAQALASIRAVLDGVYVRQVQRLNRQMVMLTIAISGGPFLGLLGTVVGVMITFAAIAQSGDVNINAIAPGIAAALVATVAGLAVAIPALFAYNYLTIRINDSASELQVFVDELISLIGETYDDRASAPSRIAAE